METCRLLTALGGRRAASATRQVKSICGENDVALHARRLATTARVGASEERCRLLVVGGGSGGCSLAASISRSCNPGDVVVLEPEDVHYYQPMFTLVGGGLKRLTQSCKPMREVLPKRARWVKDSVAAFHPDENLVVTHGERRLRYDFLLVAMGIELRFQDVPGLVEALQNPDSGVCSNYSPRYVEKTWDCLRDIKDGQALFTFPKTAVKCAGAPQKILYLADDYLRRVGRRNGVQLSYHTALPDIFGIKYYAEPLWRIAESRDIKVTLRSDLVEVRPSKREAVFSDLDNPEKRTVLPYALLHATPPQGPPAAIRECKSLADPVSGFLSVDKETLCHTRYPNVFGVGDCINAPTSKTAAATAAQTAVLRHIIRAAMQNKEKPLRAYNGYTSCPLVTGKGKCVLAEFDYNGQPLETLPIDQRKERWTMYQLKANYMPFLYWKLMLNGWWDGPAIMRKALHLGFSR